MGDGKRLNMTEIGKGIIASLVLTFVFILVIAAVCYFAEVSDRLLGLLVLAAAGISAFLGAAMAARGAGSLGLWHGAVLGIGYILIMIVSNIISERGFSPDSGLASIALCVLACGMLGGILGIRR